jgi:hypothetical protein
MRQLRARTVNDVCFSASIRTAVCVWSSGQTCRGGRTIPDDVRVLDIVVDDRVVDLGVDGLGGGHAAVVGVGAVPLDHVVALVGDPESGVDPAHRQTRGAAPRVNERARHRVGADLGARVALEPAGDVAAGNLDQALVLSVVRGLWGKRGEQSNPFGR